jgi:hypothetical protein
LGGREELKVDVEKRSAVKTDREAGFVDVLTGEGGEQRSDAGRYFPSLGFPEGDGSLSDHDEVEVGVSVEPA